MNHRDAIAALDKILKPIQSAREALEAAQTAEQTEQELKGRLEIVRAQVRLAEDQRDALSKEIAEAKVALESFNRRFAQSRVDANKELDAEITRRRTEAVTLLVADVEKLRREQEALSSATSEANASLNAVRSEHAQLQAAIAALKSSVSNLPK